MTHSLAYYLKTWNLTGPEQLADTQTSKIYTVIYKNEKAVLKLLKPAGEKDERNGAIALQSFGGDGAVKLFQYDTKAHLLEFAEGDDLTLLVKRGEDVKATNIIAGVLNKIHNSYKGIPPIELMPLNDRFDSLFKKAEEDKYNGLHSIFTRAVKVAELLLSDPKDVHILHGDIHHGNIKYNSKREWLAFDPKGLVGERTYDAANTLCNPWSMGNLVEDENRMLKISSILAEKLEVKQTRLLSFTFAHACLSASWLLEDGDDPTHAINMATIIEPHLTFE